MDVEPRRNRSGQQFRGRSPVQRADHPDRIAAAQRGVEGRSRPPRQSHPECRRPDRQGVGAAEAAASDRQAHGLARPAGDVAAAGPRGRLFDRCALDILVVGFQRHRAQTCQHECALPLPDEAMRIVRDDIAGLRRSLAPSRRVRLAGVGLAMPYNLVSWRCELDTPEAICAACAGYDFADRLRATPDLPVFVENDGTAVAIAELFERLGRQLNDFAVVYLDGAIGGGLVLDGSYRRGVTGNAGDIGLMPVAPSRLKQTPPPGRPSDILLNRTSVTGLVRHRRATA